MLIYGIEADFAMIGRMSRALMGAGIDAVPTQQPPEGEMLVIYVQSSAAVADAAHQDFLSRRRDDSILVWIDHPGAHSAEGFLIDLTDWDGEDRRHAGFRALVHACRHMLDAAAHRVVDLSRLTRIRASAARDTPPAPDTPTPPAKSLVWRSRGRGPSQGAQPAKAEADDTLDLSAFAPATVAPGKQAFVQILLHASADFDAARALATSADAGAAYRGIATLDVPVPMGTRVDLVVDAGPLAIDEAAQYLIWRGRPRACPFLLSIPADHSGQVAVTVRAFRDGVPIGRLMFQLKIAADAPDTPAPDMRGDHARRYSRAFLSYSSDDRVEVLKRVDALRATGIQVYQDLLSNLPGEKWADRIFREIDGCDLFLLFWSSHAADSDWVIREAEYALSRQTASGSDAPDIVPIILEGPPVPLPPASLGHLHFNDVMRYVIVATEMERDRRMARAQATG